MMADLIRRNRSYRRFDETRPVESSTLRSLVDLARLSPSAANRQPLKFILSAGHERNRKIFPHLAWAGYLADWPGPAEGERPTGYIVILADRSISRSVECDHGIAAQSMLLGAVERGLGGCMVGAINREGLRAALSIPEQYDILLVVALGVPAESVEIEEARGDIQYWRDESDVHHVPKRPLDELIIDLA